MAVLRNVLLAAMGLSVTLALSACAPAPAPTPTAAPKPPTPAPTPAAKPAAPTPVPTKPAAVATPVPTKPAATPSPAPKPAATTAELRLEFVQPLPTPEELDSVIDNLKQLPGVLDGAGNERSFTVRYDPQRVTPEQIERRLADMGHPVRRV